MRRAALVVAAGSFALAGCGAMDSGQSTSDRPTIATGTRSKPATSSRAHRPQWRSRVNHVIRSYYADLNDQRFDAAWNRLTPTVQVKFGGFDSWSSGYANTLSTRVTNLEVDGATAHRASADVSIRSTDRDACGDKVHQKFDGSWRLKRTAGRWRATKIRLHRVDGSTPTNDAANCDDQDTTPTSPTDGCDPSYEGACLDASASDYDCEGGSGDGPKYVQGPIDVVGDDHFDLDRDGDGVACET
jgi:hypothetical protein